MLSLPPGVSCLVGSVTENSSWFGAVGHVGSWKNDTIQYTGAAGYADFNLKFYGIYPDKPPNDDNGLEFNIEGFLFLRELTFWTKESNFFVGGRYPYFNATSKSDILGAIPGIPDHEMDDATAGSGLIVNYDSRDNIISPSNGHLAKLHTMYCSEAFGGDYDYYKIKASSYSYWPVLESVVPGVRLEGDFVGDDAPFYDVPYWRHQSNVGKYPVLIL